MPAINGKSSATRPEIELLLCCARTHVDDQRAKRITALIQDKLDWEYLLRMANRHGLMPLLYWQLNAICPELVPESRLSFLRNQFNHNAARNLYLTDELSKVIKLFAAHGISAIPFKGPVLAASVYGNLALRRFGDLDILIRKKDVAPASELLTLRGYKKQHRLTAAQEAAFLKIGFEHTFINTQGQIYLDLHWDFVPRRFPLQLDSDGFWERLGRISLGSTEVLSFALEDLFLILCLNASKEFWQRLILLCDMSEMIKARSSINWETVILEASRTGSRRMLYLSMLLAQELLGASIPKEMAGKIEADSELRGLALSVRKGLFADENESQGALRSLKPAMALERSRDRAKFYLRLAMTPTLGDWNFIKLPKRLFFLYRLTRPIRLTKDYALNPLRRFIKDNKPLNNK